MSKMLLVTRIADLKQVLKETEALLDMQCLDRDTYGLEQCEATLLKLAGIDAEIIRLEAVYRYINDLFTSEEQQSGPDAPAAV
jgi:hypothetical protein